ncbi:MAG: hypothetical protein E6H63_01185 [Betaproteobacteria bacterium]|nr:MAG: hypothetical protein E6H63_01185 [Betaproteobacteria bacterium]TMH42164.1 MAG: hypothetical protein E6H54_14535 [Betaproteobacteria bacterium]
MVALAGLTFVVLLLIPIARFRAAWRGRVTAADFRYGESPNVPGQVSLPNRNLMNLLELPVLFYVVCLAFYVTGKLDAAALYLAWAYVGLRAAHSVIHLTYNNVFHRLSAFAASNVVLVALWIHWAVALA